MHGTPTMLPDRIGHAAETSAQTGRSWLTWRRAMRKLAWFLPCVALCMPVWAAPAANDNDGNGLRGTINYFTPVQKAWAFAAAARAGYPAAAVEFYQDGNFFLTAHKGRDTYGITVDPSEKVYVSTPVASAS